VVFERTSHQRNADTSRLDTNSKISARQPPVGGFAQDVTWHGNPRQFDAGGHQTEKEEAVREERRKAMLWDHWIFCWASPVEVGGQLGNLPAAASLGTRGYNI